MIRPMVGIRSIVTIALITAAAEGATFASADSLRGERVMPKSPSEHMTIGLKVLDARCKIRKVSISDSRSSEQVSAAKKLRWLINLNLGVRTRIPVAICRRSDCPLVWLRFRPPCSM